MYIQKDSYGIRNYIVDTEDDLNTFDVDNLSMGTSCFVINTSNYYMLNSKKEWIQIDPYIYSAEGREV